MDRLQCGLNFLQSMEPTGVGARTLGECLCLQLRQKPPPKSTAVTLLAALKICTEHLGLLARRDFKKIAQLIEMDEATVRAAQGLIVALEPKPGRPFARAEEQIIIPDVIVMKVARQWRAVLNPDVMPKLRVNDLYAQAIKSQRAAAARSPRGCRRRAGSSATSSSASTPSCACRRPSSSGRRTSSATARSR
jgi:RNA polymerase sigma-54 factor